MFTDLRLAMALLFIYLLENIFIHLKFLEFRILFSTYLLDYHDIASAQCIYERYEFSEI